MAEGAEAVQYHLCLDKPRHAERRCLGPQVRDRGTHAEKASVRRAEQHARRCRGEIARQSTPHPMKRPSGLLLVYCVLCLLHLSCEQTGRKLQNHELLNSLNRHGDYQTFQLGSHLAGDWDSAFFVDRSSYDYVTNDEIVQIMNGYEDIDGMMFILLTKAGKVASYDVLKQEHGIGDVRSCNGRLTAFSRNDECVLAAKCITGKKYRVLYNVTCESAEINEDRCNELGNRTALESITSLRTARPSTLSGWHHPLRAKSH